MSSEFKTKKVLSLSMAKKLVSRAVKKAEEMNVGGAFAVVDDSGNLIYLERIDGTIPAAANIAIGKAATASAFRRPTIILEKLIHDERPVMANLNGITNTPYVPLMGAYPVYFDGEIAGAISVAGAQTGSNDEIIARHAVEQINGFKAEKQP